MLRTDVGCWTRLFWLLLFPESSGSQETEQCFMCLSNYCMYSRCPFFHGLYSLSQTCHFYNSTFKGRSATCCSIWWRYCRAEAGSPILTVAWPGSPTILGTVHETPPRHKRKLLMRRPTNKRDFVGSEHSWCQKEARRQLCPKHTFFRWGKWNSVKGNNLARVTRVRKELGEEPGFLDS